MARHKKTDALRVLLVYVAIQEKHIDKNESK